MDCRSPPPRAGLGAHFVKETQAPKSPPLAFFQKLCGPQASSVGKPRLLQVGETLRNAGAVGTWGRGP